MSDSTAILPLNYTPNQVVLPVSFTPKVAILPLHYSPRIAILRKPIDQGAALVGTIDSTATFAGILKVRKLLSGVIICETTWLGTLKTGAQLAGNMPVDVTFAGILGIGGIAPAQLVGDIPVDVTFVGVLTARQLMSGEIACTVTFASTLKTGAKLAGDIAASADFAGTLKAVAKLIGDIPVDAVFASTLKTGAKLVGDISAEATFASTLKTAAKLIGNIASDVTFASTIKTGAKLIGDIPVDVTFAGTLTVGGAAAILGLSSSSGGMATNASQALYPNLWFELVGLWAPSIGPQGGKLRDLSGRENHGTINGFSGGISSVDGWFPGPKGLSLCFDGTGSNINIGNKAILDFTSGFTISVWYMHTSSAADFAIVAKIGTYPGYMLWKQSGANAVKMYINDGAAQPSTRTLTVGKWYHIVGTWNGSTVSIYTNGVLDASAAYSTAPSSSSHAFILGQYAGSFNMTGRMGDVMVYRRCLRNSEISQIYDGASPLIRRPY